MNEYMIVGMTVNKVFYTKSFVASDRLVAYVMFGAILGDEASSIVSTYDFNMTSLLEACDFNQEQYSIEYEEMIKLSIEICESYDMEA